MEGENFKDGIERPTPTSRKVEVVKVAAVEARGMGPKQSNICVCVLLTSCDLSRCPGH
jgi:hypothetical protein